MSSTFGQLSKVIRETQSKGDEMKRIEANTLHPVGCVRDNTIQAVSLTHIVRNKTSTTCGQASKKQGGSQKKVKYKNKSSTIKYYPQIKQGQTNNGLNNNTTLCQLSCYKV